MTAGLESKETVLEQPPTGEWTVQDHTGPLWFVIKHQKQIFFFLLHVKRGLVSP